MVSVVGFHCLPDATGVESGVGLYCLPDATVRYLVWAFTVCHILQGMVSDLGLDATGYGI